MKSSVNPYWTGDRETCPHCGGTGLLQHPAPLTRRQAEIYRFVYAFHAHNGFAPSFEEIAANFQYRSLATVHEHLINLERKGYLTRSYNESRGIICRVDPDAPGAAA